MNLKNLLLATMVFFVFGCTTTRSVSTMEGTYEGMEVYTVKIPDKNFTEIKLIQVQGGHFSGPKGLMDKLILEAKKEGANGLVNVQYNSLHVGSTISGTAVKFEAALDD